MKDPSRKVVYLQWLVISALILGAAAGGYLLVHKADDLQQSNDELKGDNLSLQNQLRELRASPSPSTAPLPDASGNRVTPSPSPSVTPSPTKTPTPTATPKKQ